ncbi:phage regulatory CII family protein [Variovorax sp. EBFNA2]|uniref:phage regulatory CII family protein n=1 Tax=Variovorax sp. EBFNA2 TaxID=3342097 RepID=UPI0029C03611|nr:phage regulatory CII family protein [Variovorax boronicumulans]WPG35149.1 phage regulatory CII family protein [Variovorax boronicumulans]
MTKTYPGGTLALARRITTSEKAASTMDKELRGAPGFKLGVFDALEMSALCIEMRTPGSLDFMTALAAELGVLIIPLPRTEGANTPEAVRALASHSSQSAALLAEACNSLADNDISDNELLRCQRRAADAVASIQALLQAMAEINLAGKPQGGA